MNYSISHTHCLKCHVSYLNIACQLTASLPYTYRYDLSAHITRQQSNLIQHFDTYHNWSILLPIDQQTHRLKF